MRSTSAPRRWARSLASGASLSLLLISGCATAPSPDPWASIVLPDQAPAQAEALVDWPAPVSETDQTVTFDLEGATALLKFQTIAEGNTGIAKAHASQIVELQKALAGMLEAGKAQRRVADLRLEILQEERRQHVIEKLGLYALMIATLGVAAL